jgi:hypothetical protein
MNQDEYPFPYALSKAEATVLKRALTRPPDYLVCPTPGLWGAAQTSVLRSLRGAGFLIGEGEPTLTAKGIALATKLTRLEREAAQRSKNYTFSKGPPERPPVSARSLEILDMVKEMLARAHRELGEQWMCEQGVRTPRMADALVLLERAGGKLAKEIADHKKKGTTP